MKPNNTLESIVALLADTHFEWQSDSCRSSLLKAGLYLPVSYLDANDVQRSGYEAVAIARYGVLKDEAQWLAEVCSELNIGGYWLKGWTSKDRYKDPWRRLMADLDLLVPPDSVELLADEMVRRGFRRPKAVKPWPANFEVALVAPSGILVEVHGSIGPWMVAEPWNKILEWPKEGLFCLPPHWHLLQQMLHCFQHAGQLKGYQWLDLALTDIEYDQSWVKLLNAGGGKPLAAYAAVLLEQKLGRNALPTWVQEVLNIETRYAMIMRIGFKKGLLRYAGNSWKLTKTLLLTLSASDRILHRLRKRARTNDILAP